MNPDSEVSCERDNLYHTKASEKSMITALPQQNRTVGGCRVQLLYPRPVKKEKGCHIELINERYSLPDSNISS